MGSHPSAPIGKLCPSAFSLQSLILARSFWTGRDVSSAEVHGLLELLARLPSPFEMPVARKEEPDDADKALTTSLIHLLRTSRKSAVTRSMRSEGPCEVAESSGTFGWDSLAVPTTPLLHAPPWEETFLLADVVSRQRAVDISLDQQVVRCAASIGIISNEVVDNTQAVGSTRGRPLWLRCHRLTVGVRRCAARLSLASFRERCRVSTGQTTRI